jgi:hypothetical protein
MVKRLLFALLLLVSAAVYADPETCIVGDCTCGYQQCYADCQSYGPPSPGCVNTCNAERAQCNRDWWGGN